MVGPFPFVPARIIRCSSQAGAGLKNVTEALSMGGRQI